ncbi:MAG: trypsin-like serine protease, partial [Myxococcales bacterium]|nr:trypsin-like serine protease [Myxococcales bacterium]
RRTTNSISKLYQVEFRFDGGQSTCKGDSGGPAFATLGGREVQIGVTSRGAMPCGTSAIDTRVDTFVDWIKQVSGGDVNDGADTTAPTIAITAPTDGATLEPGTVTITTQASDDSGTVASVQLLVDGQPASSKTAAPFNFTVELTTPGSHTIEVVAKDGADNEGRASATVTVNDPQPQNPQNPQNPPQNPQTPPPGTATEPGAFGAECSGPTECDSGLCAYDPSADKHYCTQQCDPSATPCPGQSDCMPTNNPGAHVCGAPQLSGSANQATPDGNLLVGSCAIAPSGELLAQGAWMLPLLLGLALLRIRRRLRLRSRRHG